MDFTLQQSSHPFPRPDGAGAFIHFRRFTDPVVQEAREPGGMVAQWREN
jgi:hypothetical protein